MITITNKDIGREVRLRSGETGTIVGWCDVPGPYQVDVRIGNTVSYRYPSGRILFDEESSGDIVAFTDETETKPMITITKDDIGRKVRLFNGDVKTLAGVNPGSMFPYLCVNVENDLSCETRHRLRDCGDGSLNGYADIVAFADEKETKPMTTPNHLSKSSKEYLDQFLKDYNLVAIPEPEGGLKSCSKCALQGTQMCQEAPCGFHNVHFENAPQLTPDERKCLDAPTSEFANSFSRAASNESDPTGRAPSTPGAKLDAGKAPVLRGVLQYFPRAILAVAEVSAHGASKYTWNGWETVPDGIPRYGDALVRHLIKEAIEGPADKDSHLTHMAHEAWNALARLELMLREKNGKELSSER